jgi:GINS complex subunit 4
MDDIDDILADVSSPAAGPTAAADLQSLVRAWTTERLSPDLAPWPAALMARCSARISAQVAAVEEAHAQMAAAASHPAAAAAAGGGGGGADSRGATLAAIVRQTELERHKFLVRGVVRARLAKLDARAEHYAQLLASQADAAAGAGAADGKLLSPDEERYLHAHAALRARLHAAAFLAQFPAQLRRLDDRAGGAGGSGGMVEGPDEDRAVFVRVLRGGGEPVVLPGGDGRAAVRLRKGDVWVLRWRAVKDGVGRGDLELI